MKRNHKRKLLIIILLSLISIISETLLLINKQLPAFIIILIVTVLINFILFYDFFCDFTMLYPLNNRSEYFFNPEKNELGLVQEKYYKLTFVEKEKGVWELENNSKKMKFNMKGYLFQKKYICSYFIRNINFVIINKNKYPLPKLFKSLELKSFNKYHNFELNFKYKNKSKVIKIVENSKTKVGFLIGLIIESRYSVLGLGGKSYNNRLYEYEKINEDIYDKARIPKKIIYKKKRK